MTKTVMAKRTLYTHDCIAHKPGGLKLDILGKQTCGLLSSNWTQYTTEVNTDTIESEHVVPLFFGLAPLNSISKRLAQRISVKWSSPGKGDIGKKTMI